MAEEKEYFVHPTSVVDPGAAIGENTKIWHFSHIMANTRIGSDCNLGQNVVAGPDVTIGRGCKIQNNVSVYKGVTLEDEVFCGPSMVFTNVFNPRSHIRRMDEVRPTLVKKGASIGANATIVCGVTIGAYAFVGAGAVVTKDVPDHALVLGNPARQTGWVCECGEKLDKNRTCPACGRHLGPEADPAKKSYPFIDLGAQQRKIRASINAGIQKVLDHGKYIMGPEINELEENLAEFAGVSHAVSCGSGTDALVMALMAYGIGPGDAVFTTPFTFVATAEAIRLVGAVPVFADIDPQTFNLSPAALKAAVKEVAAENRLNAKAVIPVDLYGLPCDYEKINAIAGRFNLKVIQDAAQSFGADYKGRRACAQGHAGCTSFFPAKPLGCYGDGGAVFTDSDETAEILRSIRIHGKGHDKYDNVRTGLNARMDTIQAAVLLSKLEIFQEELEARQTVAQRYTELLSPLADRIILPNTFPGMTSAWAQYSILARDAEARNRIQEGLKEKGIPTAVYYPKPLHLQQAYGDLGYRAGAFPVSEDFASRTMSIPMHPYLTEKDQDDICRVFHGLLNE